MDMEKTLAQAMEAIDAVSGIAVKQREEIDLLRGIVNDPKRKYESVGGNTCKKVAADVDGRPHHVPAVNSESSDGVSSSQNAVSVAVDSAIVNNVPPFCGVHKVNCVQRTVQKNNSNFGRRFWSCPKMFGCYFKWCKDTSPCIGFRTARVVSSSDHIPLSVAVVAKDHEKNCEKGLESSMTGGSPVYGDCSVINTNGLATEAKTFWQSAESIHREGMWIKFVDSFDSSKRINVGVRNHVGTYWEVINTRVSEYVELGVLVPCSLDQVKFVASLSVVPR